METEVQQIKPMTDNEGQEHKEYGDRNAREEEPTEKMLLPPTMTDPHATAMEEMKQTEEGTEQQEYNVRSAATPETTSDNDMRVHKK
jgi:hypothetical protein